MRGWSRCAPRWRWRSPSQPSLRRSRRYGRPSPPFPPPLSSCRGPFVFPSPLQPHTVVGLSRSTCRSGGEEDKEATQLNPPPPPLPFFAHATTAVEDAAGERHVRLLLVASPATHRERCAHVPAARTSSHASSARAPGSGGSGSGFKWRCRREQQPESHAERHCHKREKRREKRWPGEGRRRHRILR